MPGRRPALHTALAQHAITAGAYVNSLPSDDADRIRDSCGNKYERLARIEAAVDPDNIPPK
jgi:hypothetical protein